MGKELKTTHTIIYLVFRIFRKKRVERGNSKRRRERRGRKHPSCNLSIHHLIYTKQTHLTSSLHSQTCEIIPSLKPQICQFSRIKKTLEISLCMFKFKKLGSIGNNIRACISFQRVFSVLTL